MPFPLAHPAAVLPFRCWCPGRLSFLALVVGSVTPDVAYCSGPLKLAKLAHAWLGTFVFCLPAGWLLVLICLGIREPLASLLPNPHRDALLRMCRRAREPFGMVTVSLLIGAGTHIFLDGFTHREGWCTQRFDVLRARVPTVGGYEAPVYRILWYALSLAGLVWLAWSYARWLKGAASTAGVGRVPEKWRYGIWALMLALPYAAIVPFTIHLADDRPLVYGIHRFIHASVGVYLVVVSLLLMLLGFGLRLRGSERRRQRDA